MISKGPSGQEGQRPLLINHSLRAQACALGGMGDLRVPGGPLPTDSLGEEPNWTSGSGWGMGKMTKPRSTGGRQTKAYLGEGAG